MSGKNTPIMALGGLLVAGGLAYFALAKGSEPAAKPKAAPAHKVAGAMTEEERVAYVKQFVQVSDIEIGVDVHVKADGTSVETPGLLKVTGKVTNTGDKKVRKIVFVLNPKDAEGKVLGTDQEDIAENKVLAPGASRDFSFTIREREGFKGDYEHRLK